MALRNVARWILSVLIPAAAAIAEAGGAPHFPYGVAAGEIRSTGAILWTRVDREAIVTVEVSRDPAFRHSIRQARAARVSSDLTVRFPVSGLAPSTDYSYRFLAGAGVSEVGRFRTAPRDGESVALRFAWGSDFDGSPIPPINQFETLDRAREDSLDFFVFNGDTIYADNPPACDADLGCMRAKYLQNREYPALRSLLGATGSYAIWDDHEVADNWAGATVDPALLASGRKAFTEYFPVPAPRPDTGFYRSVRWGKEAELFFLDERSFRSAEADGACQNDLLPTLPADVRALAGLPPAPPDGCLETLADPARTILGRAQKARFERALEDSTATWKIIVNEVAIAELYGLPYDRWEGYAAERQEILDAIRSRGIRNVVFLTGDLHANMSVAVRSAADPQPAPYGTELIAGPVAERTLLEELTGLLGSQEQAEGFIGLVTDLAAPDCFVTDAYAYGLVEVDPLARTLTVTIKDGAGAALCSTTLVAR